MRRLSTGLVAWMLAAPAFAQAPPPVGATVDSFEMIPDRVVIFEPTADGKARIVKVDQGRNKPVPREPGQVAVAMTYALEIGTVLDFNSGLDHDFTYKATPVTEGAQALPTCSVMGDAVMSDQWPLPVPRLVLSGFAKHQGRSTC
jgi:hypothetical protein